MTELQQQLGKLARENPEMLKHFIMYEAAKGTPVFEVYKEMCRMFGDDIMEYQDFEFWFMKSARGEFDVDYDRSKDPRMRGLMDMPVTLFEEIMNHLDMSDRHVVAKVSTGLRNTIKEIDPKIESLVVQFSVDSAKLHMNNQVISYKEEEAPKDAVYTVACSVHMENKKRLVPGASFLECILQDLKLMLDNPKLQLETFHFAIKTRIPISDEIKTVFQRLTWKIKTTNVKITTANQREEFLVLPYLEPATLELVEIDIANEPVGHRNEAEFKQRMYDIGNLPQCIQAHQVQFEMHPSKASWFDVESFYNCRRLSLEFTVIYRNDLDIKNVVRYKNAVLKSPLLSFHLQAQCWFTKSVFRRRLGKRAFPVPNNTDVYIIESQNSNVCHVVDFSASGGHIMIIDMDLDYYD